MNRRHFLYGASAALAAMGVTLPSRAVESNDRKLIFVFAPGGWDVTRVFAPEFANPNVSMEANAERATRGDLAWVSSPERPSVDLFFENHHARTVIFNGMMVRSIAHDICTMIALTGTSSGLAPDWPAIVANRDREAYTLPHLVVERPVVPGRSRGRGRPDRGRRPARGPGQRPGRETGARSRSRTRTGWTRASSTGTCCAGPSARAANSRSTVEQGLVEAFRDSTAKVTDLKGLRYTMDFTASLLLEDQARVAVDALKGGVSRCVTLAYAGTNWKRGYEGCRKAWDRHDRYNGRSCPQSDDLLGKGFV